MSNFNPFVDFKDMTDDAIMERMAKLNEMINYYYNSNYNYLLPQLQGWRDACVYELQIRNEKRRQEKFKKKNPNENVIFDNSEEALEAARAKKNKDKDNKPVV